MLVSSPNKELGRRGMSPDAIVIHRTDGTFASGLSWCLNSVSQVSYHGIIRQDGFFQQIVEYKDTAWHAGKVVNASWRLLKERINPNLYTIGIAISGAVSELPTIDQIATCAKLVKELCKKYSIPLDREHIIGHYEIRQDKTCPGALVHLDTILYLASLSV